MNLPLCYKLVAILSLAFTYARAQNDSTQLLYYGARIGGVVSKFSNGQPHTESGSGFVVGGVVEYPLTDAFSLQAEPAYLQLAGTYIRFTDNTRFGDSGMFAVYTTASDIKLHYIDLPILIRYNFMPVGDFAPNVVAGGAVSGLLHATDRFERTYHYNQTFFTVNDREDITSEFQNIQCAVVAGFGGEISLGERRLLIDIRYRYGITQAKKSFSYIDLNAVKADLYTNAVYFTLGVGL